MDIEGNIANWNWRNVFHPIQQFPLAVIQQQKVVSQNVFRPTIIENSTSLVLSLAGQYLILSEGDDNQPTPIAAANLSFDLKFQVFHQI